MLRRSSCLAAVALWLSLNASAQAASDDLSVGGFSTGMWYSCSDQKVAENIAQTFVVKGWDAAMNLFNHNSLVCDVSIGPTKLYVHSVVWYREMHGDGAKMKVVLMSEWKDNQPSKHYYVLTLR